MTSTSNPKTITPSNSSRWASFLSMVALPCLISVAAIDPGNLEVDLQAGSALGYRLIWALLLSSVIGFLMQALAAHLTILTKTHLAQALSSAYSNHPIVHNSIFIILELSVIAFDIAEVVGTAFALKLLFGFPLWLGMIFSALDTLLVLFLQRNGTSVVELLIEGMLFILALCLFFEFYLAKPSLPGMLSGAIFPTLGEDTLKGVLLAISMLGSVIMAHNLFLHSWLMVSREESHMVGDKRTSCKHATFESAGIFIATFLVNACVLALTAALPQDSRPEDIGLQDAGALLQNVLGNRYASTAWAVALLTSGHAATVTGTLASQAICEGFLHRDRDTAGMMIMLTRGFAIVPAVIGALVAGEKGSDTLIVFSQIVLSLALPFAVLPLLKVFHAVFQGEKHGSEWLITAGHICFVILFVANLFVVWEINRELVRQFGMTAAFGVSAVGLLSFILLVVILVIKPDVSEIRMRAFTNNSDEEQPLIETGSF